MSELQTQLHDYFDEVVERVNVQDVLAQVHVRRQRTLRPVWAAATGAAAVTIGVGSVVAANWLASLGLQPVRSFLRAMTSAAGWTSWVPSILIGVVVGLMVVAVSIAIFRRRGGRMDTIERTSPPEVRTRTTSSWLVIVLAVALVLALAAIVWLLVAPPGSSTSAVPTDVQAVLDDYYAAENAHDGAAVAAFGATFRINGSDYTGPQLAAFVNLRPANWTVTPTGRPTVIETPAAVGSYYVIAQPGELAGYFGTSEEELTVFRVLRHDESGQVEILSVSVIGSLSGG
jgi:hypothetical protein